MEHTCGEKVTDHAQPAIQTASSSLSETTSCRAAPGSDFGHPLIALFLLWYVTVILALCDLMLTLMKMYGDI